MDLGKGVTMPFSEKLIMKPVSKEIILLAANIWMSLKTQLLCGFRLYLFEWTVLEFGNADQLADCGCILRLFADSLHRTQSADCRISQIQDYISERPDFFFRCVLLYTVSVWKVNIRNACILPVRAKCGRFCVLMNGRVIRHRKLFVFRTAATVLPPYWQNGGLYSPDLTATDRLLVPANAKAGSAARSPQTSRFLAEGIIGHARSSSAAEFSGLCPPPLSQSWGSNRKTSSHAASY